MYGIYKYTDTPPKMDIAEIKASSYEEAFLQWNALTFDQIEHILQQNGIPMPRAEFWGNGENGTYTRRSHNLIEKILILTRPVTDHPLVKMLEKAGCVSIRDYLAFRRKNKYLKLPCRWYQLKRKFGDRFGFQLIDPNRHLYYETHDECCDAMAKSCLPIYIDMMPNKVYDYARSINPKLPPCPCMYYPHNSDNFQWQL